MKKLLAGNILLLFVLFTIGCGNDKNDESHFLHGKWEIDTAIRNGKKTELLTGLFFQFVEDGSMRTNITGQPESVHFELAENKITQREGRIDIDYDVISLTDSTLVLQTSIRNSALELNLKKVTPLEIK